MLASNDEKEVLPLAEAGSNVARSYEITLGLPPKPSNSSFAQGFADSDFSLSDFADGEEMGNHPTGPIANFVAD